MWDFVLHRILRRPFAMRTRYDRRPTRRPAVTIVFLHGIASSYNVWKPTISALAKEPSFKNARLVAVDLIGFGKCAHTRYFTYDYPSYRKSLAYTLRKLRIRTPIILVGHSMGSLIAADYATAHPSNIQSLILTSPPFLRPADLRRLPDKFYTKTYTTLSDHAANPIVGTLASFISKVSAFDHHRLNTPAFRNCMQNLILNPQNWHTALHLHLPTQIIHGHLDPLVVGANLRALAKQNSHITLTETIGGHEISTPKRHKITTILKTIIQN